MSYKKGYAKGYQEGLSKGIKIALDKYAYAIDFAGAIRKKQNVILVPEIKRLSSQVETPTPICGFDMAYAGSCKSTKILDNGQCEKHQDKCCMCNKPATKSCSYAGQFVCGAPTCDNCNHYSQHR
tara:strand:+ start:297 stop:671 length:375 start_codon:yes stop_codon:yes gene_type:complete